MAFEKSVLAEAIAAHWDALKRQKVEVPEWNGAVIYYDPLTISERDQLNRSASNEYAVDAIILKAQNENGERLFGKADKMQLMNAASGSVIGRVAAAILSADAVDVDRLGEH